MEKRQKSGRKFSKKEKLEILQEARVKGVKVTLLKYDVFHATYYYWRKQYLTDGSESGDYTISILKTQLQQIMEQICREKTVEFPLFLMKIEFKQ